MWYPIKTPLFVKKIFPNMLWSYPPTTAPCIYLSFDDGPIPEITDWVLAQLKQYEADATFFCIGRNVERNPDVYSRILAAGHSVGNHTYNHLNGWKCKTGEYLENVAACAQSVDSKLFRPPYGRLRMRQSRALLKLQYRPVMWDVIAGDFDTRIDGEKCWQNILHFTKNGSIIVLHDSKKAWPRLEYVLPKLLDHYSQLGYSFKAIR
jgi:peptidoglycan/xylan/chitin deacetylase (PgdA/CDA1 family)